MNPHLIDLSEPTLLHSVWELHDGYWELLTIVRLRKAITTSRESPLTRLVFPTVASPQGVWNGIYNDERTTPKEHQKAGSLLEKRQERVLELLKLNPGQTRDQIASSLDVSVATARQLLRPMEDLGDIHSRPHPMRNKTKLYYIGIAPTNTGTTDNQSSSVRSANFSPPVKVYFVDPKTLQGISK